MEESQWFGIAFPLEKGAAAIFPYSYPSSDLPQKPTGVTLKKNNETSAGFGLTSNQSSQASTRKMSQSTIRGESDVKTGEVEYFHPFHRKRIHRFCGFPVQP